MRHYKLTFTENVKAQEYTYEYLLKARSLNEARRTAKRWISDWYSGDHEWSDDDTCEFDGGCLAVRKIYIIPTTKKQFAKDLLLRFTI